MEFRALHRIATDHAALRFRREHVCLREQLYPVADIAVDAREDGRVSRAEVGNELAETDMASPSLGPPDSLDCRFVIQRAERHVPRPRHDERLPHRLGSG